MASTRSKKKRASGTPVYRAQPTKDEPPTGVGEREGWEDFERKREWFLISRGISEGGSRSDARLTAIAHAETLGLAPLESLDPGGLAPRSGAELAGRIPKAATLRRVAATRQLAKARLLAPAVEVRSTRSILSTSLKIRIAPAALAKADAASIRIFRFEPSSATWQLVPRSGFSAHAGYAWARLHRAGVYAPLGLPADGEEFADLVRTFNARVALRETASSGGKDQRARVIAATLGRRSSGQGAKRSSVAARVKARPELPEWQLLAELADAAQPPGTQRRGYRVAVQNQAVLAAFVMERDWWKLGPRNINGRIKSLAIHPVNRNLLYAGAANGGIWITVNAGMDWNALWFHQLSMAIGAIAIAPSNPAVMYAATGEDTPGWGPSYGGVGVLKSNNGGAAWSPCGSGPGSRSNKLLVHPGNPAIVYVGCDNGFWKSVDGGTTWALKRPGRVTDALLDPTAPETLYLAAHVDGVYKSENGGDTWIAKQGVTSGFFTALPWGAAAEWINLAMGRGGSVGTRFIAAKMGADSGRVFVSTTGGDNWVAVPGDPIQPASYNEWTNVIAVHPRFSNRILAGAVGLSLTTTTWTFDPTTGTHSDHHQIVYDPVDPTICYVATDGGVYRSADGGKTWTLRSRGMVATQFYSLGVAQTNPLLLGGATQDQGIIRLKSGSDLDWDDLHAGNEGGFFVVDPNNSRNIYTTPWSADLRRSTDAGATWVNIRNGMTTIFNGVTTDPAHVRHLAVRFGFSSHLISAGVIVVRDPDGNELLHRSGLYLTVTQGNQWTFRAETEGDVTRVAFAPAGDDLVCYAATATGNVYRSGSGGWTWRLAHTAANRPSTAYITGLAISWTDPDLLYISFGGFSGPRIMRSNDAGAHWTNCSGTPGDDMPDIPINTIVVDPNNSDVVYAGTDIGIFRTLDGGVTWQDFNDGWQWQDVPRVIVTELALRRSSRTLFASTLGRGVYRRVL